MKRSVVTALLLACLAAAAGHAAVITSGFIDIPGGAGTFLLNGPEVIEVSGGICVQCSSWHVTLPHLDVPGSMVEIVGGASGGDLFGFGTYTPIGTMNVGRLVVDGPTIALNAGEGTYTGTFTLSGFLCIFNNNIGACGGPLVDLTGSGIVTLDVIRVPNVPGSPDILQVRRALYTFTPEPGTWMLMGAGLGAIWTRRRLALRVR